MSADSFKNKKKLTLRDVDEVNIVYLTTTRTLLSRSEEISLPTYNPESSSKSAGPMRNTDSSGLTILLEWAYEITSQTTNLKARNK